MNSFVGGCQIGHAVIRSTEALGNGIVGVLFDESPASHLLWHWVIRHQENAIPVVIEHGLHPPAFHDLLHQMYRSGSFPVAIWRNDPVLATIRSGVIHISELAPDYQRIARAFTKADAIPYTLQEPAVRELLVEWPYREVLQRYDILYRPETWESDPTLPYMERIGMCTVVRPLLHVSQEQVTAAVAAEAVQTMQEPARIKREEGAVDQLDVLVDRACEMASPSREEYIQSKLAEFPGHTLDEVLTRVKENLALWKGGRVFGHA